MKNINPLEKVVESDVKKFFTFLGYKVDWDFSHRSNERWYEILDGDDLVCQIDQEIPVEDIIKDMICWHLGKNPTSKSDYKCSLSQEYNGKSLPESFKKLLKKVYEYSSTSN